MLYARLPVDLWDLIGDFIYSDVFERPDGSIEVEQRYARAFEITFDDGEAFLHPLHCALS